jgi:hypothetical protein
VASPMEQEFIAPMVRTGRIIIGALIAGVLSFLLLVIFVIRPAAHAAGPQRTFLSYYVVPPFVGTTLILAAWIPRLITARVRRTLAQIPELNVNNPREDLGPLLGAYQTQMIVGAALCESGAFFAAICYFLEGSPFVLVVALIALAALASHFPSATSVEQWVDEQRERIERQRHGGF